MTTLSTPLAPPVHSAAARQRASALSGVLDLGTLAEQLFGDLATLVDTVCATPPPPDATGAAPGRSLSATQEQALLALSRRATELLEQRRRALPQLQAQESEAARRRERLLQITTTSTHSLDLQSFIDPGYIYRYVNDRYLEYWACRRDQIEGRTMAQLIGEEVFQRSVKPMVDRAFEGQHATYETVVDYPGRGRRHVRATFMPAHDEQGSIHGVVMRVEDVDELMQAQDELRRTVHLLERRTEEQQRFIHMISHDLREPINSICNFSGLLEQDHAHTLDAQAQRYLGFVSQGGQRMRALLDGLLDYVRLEGQPLQCRPVAVAGLIDEVRADLALALEHSGGQLHCDPLPTVDADATLLRVLLQNLVSNAIKFHRPGVPPLVQVVDDSNATQWRVAVRDQGIGIAAEHLGRLFGLFKRLRARREYEGTGLGLATCKRIAELHGGHIEVQSQPDIGSTFTLSLPRRSEAVR